MKVMIIDDDAGSLRGMIVAIGLLGHDCDAYGDPADASYYYSCGKYDAVIADLRMPSMNGIQLMVTIHAVDPAIPVIIVSGQADRKWAQEALDRGALAFLEKPLDAAELSKILDKISA
jgi:DNA-binding NtrC family response regulator